MHAEKPSIGDNEAEQAVDWMDNILNEETSGNIAVEIEKLNVNECALDQNLENA